jgi:hypothetical protein
VNHNQTKPQGLDPVKPAERIAWATRDVLDAVARLTAAPHDTAQAAAVRGRYQDLLRLVDAHPHVREITVPLTESPRCSASRSTPSN